MLDKRIELLEEALQKRHIDSSSSTPIAAGKKSQLPTSTEEDSGEITGATFDIGRVRDAEGSKHNLELASDPRLTEADALAQELRSAETFSHDYLGGFISLADTTSLSQALAGLGEAIADLGNLTRIVSNDDPNALLTRGAAQERVTGMARDQNSAFSIPLMKSGETSTSSSHKWATC
jgi:hypothetical protein